MRHQRWEANGGIDPQPAESDANLAPPWDEDAEPQDADVVSGALSTVTSPAGADADESDDEAGYDRSQFDDASVAAHDDAAPPVEPIRPFADLPSLPADVNDAFEAYKLCILRHKLAGWQEISREDLVSSLESLKQLALMPADA